MSYSASVPNIVGGYLLAVGQNLASIFPSFEISAWLNEKGIRAARLLQYLQGCYSVLLELVPSQPDLYQESWNSSW